MGYTHTWRLFDEPAADAWQTYTADVAAIIAAAPATAPEHYYGDNAAVPLAICGPFGDGPPEITPDLIAFNGDAGRRFSPGAATLADADARGYDRRTFPVVGCDHETFHCPRTAGSQFCKTARKPYDVVVVACLLALADRLTARVTSDGDAGDLAAGQALWRRAIPGRVVPPGPWRA